MISDKAIACPHCGAVINQGATFSVQNNTQQVGPSTGGISSRPQKKSPAPRIILTVFGTLLLLYLAIIAFGYVKYGFFSANPVHWGKVIDAERGDAGEQYWLGYDYLNGTSSDILVNIPQDANEAVKWLRMAANHEEEYYAIIAQNQLGVCFFDGVGSLQDDNEAVKWFRMAAGQGNADAQNYLGWCYQEGRGVSQDYYEAAKWFRMAAGQGNADAQNNLGVCYYRDQNYNEAVKWFRMAADQGKANAQSNLGWCYQKGRGVSQDYHEAVKWYRMAANAYSCESAWFHLGDCYEHGYGVSPDLNEAIKWYREAADRGNKDARLALKRLGY